MSKTRPVQERRFLLMTTPHGTNKTTFHRPYLNFEDAHRLMEHYREQGGVRVHLQDVTHMYEQFGDDQAAATAYERAMSVV